MDCVSLELKRTGKKRSLRNLQTTNKGNKLKNCYKENMKKQENIHQ